MLYYLDKLIFNSCLKFLFLLFFVYFFVKYLKIFLWVKNIKFFLVKILNNFVNDMFFLILESCKNVILI